MGITNYIKYKVYLKGAYYHIFNRGNDKRDIFLDNSDFQFYLRRLITCLSKFEFSLICYCLMPNHVHLLLQQNSEVPSSKLISSLHTSYSMYFNMKYKHIGHVFESRFKQKLIESDEYLIHLSRYIHLNPVEAGLVKKPETYKWSSYNNYLVNEEGLIDNSIIMNFFKDKNDYQKFVEAQLNKYDWQEIRNVVIE